MRQGGLRPKNHNSGTYWIRANANTGGRKRKQEDAYNDLDAWQTLNFSVITAAISIVVCLVIAYV